MTTEQVRKLHRLVHAHTKRCLFEYADDGHGAEIDKALKSAFELIERIVEVCDAEGHKTADAIAGERR